MIKFIWIFSLTICALVVNAQADINGYLKTHHYAFSLDKGFEQPVSDSLKQKLKGYKLVLQAEGGSHSLAFYKRLPLLWIRFLNVSFGLTHFFLESGHSSDILMNKYLQTGDSSYCYTSDKSFWKSLYAYNLNLPENKKLKYFGIDFERASTYIRALKLILPGAATPETIKPFIDLIKNADDTLKDCDYIININKELRSGISNNKKQFVEYFGVNYSDLERVVLNNGDCKDVHNNRNKNMASGFLSFDQDFKQPIYFGELGEAHTVLINKNTASILNRSVQFKNKVCVVNLYCYNCTTASEQVSNWPLKKIEKDILEYFLPYCNTNFTLFDLSDDIELTKKYNVYGQFLVLVKNQE